MSKEESNENPTIRSMVQEMKKKFLKYWKHSYVTICIPIILDPRSKRKFLEYNLKDDPTVDGPRCLDRKSTRLNSSHITRSRMPSSA